MKKKVIFSIVVILSAIFISSCGEDRVGRVEAKNEKELFELVDYFYINDDIRIEEYRDTETGVHYFGRSIETLYSGMGGMCPRYNADGSLYVD